MLRTIYLCHSLINGSTNLSLTYDKANCYGDHEAQQIWVEKYNLNDRWEQERLSAICGWSHKRCPLLRGN